MKIENYINLLNPLYLKGKNYRALARGLMEVFFDLLCLSEALGEMYDLTKAKGVFLDFLGQMVGVGRVMPIRSTSARLNDDLYRKVIKAKIAINTWNGTMETLPDVLNSVFPELNIVVTDHQNMTVTATLREKVSGELLDILNNGYLIPRSYGVDMNYILPTESTQEQVPVKRGQALVSFRESEEE